MIVGVIGLFYEEILILCWLGVKYEKLGFIKCCRLNLKYVLWYSYIFCFLSFILVGDVLFKL